MYKQQNEVYKYSNRKKFLHNTKIENAVILYNNNEYDIMNDKNK